MRYRADPPAAYRVVPLDSLTALYHRRSGTTHLLAEPVPELLEVLGAGPLSFGNILAALDIDDDAESRAALTARLDEMAATGLIAAA